MKNNKLLKFRIYLTLKSLEAYTKYKNSKKRIGPFFFVFISILFLELMTKKIMIGHIFSLNLIYMILFFQYYQALHG